MSQKKNQQSRVSKRNQKKVSSKAEKSMNISKVRNDIKKKLWNKAHQSQRKSFRTLRLLMDCKTEVERARKKYKDSQKTKKYDNDLLLTVIFALAAIIESVNHGYSNLFFIIFLCLALFWLLMALFNRPSQEHQTQLYIKYRLCLRKYRHYEIMHKYQETKLADYQDTRYLKYTLTPALPKSQRFTKQQLDYIVNYLELRRDHKNFAMAKARMNVLRMNVRIKKRHDSKKK